MTDIGYPTTTNRAGAWYRKSFGNAQAVAPRVNLAAPNHLSEVLRPLRERGLRSMSLYGMDDMAAQLRDLTGGDQQKMDILGRAIDDAVTASKKLHPLFIGRDKSDHGLPAAEVKRRAQWCVDIAHQMRFDQKPPWSIEKIYQKLPHLLLHFLRGTFETAIRDSNKRAMYAKNQIPVDLRPDPSDET